MENYQSIVAFYEGCFEKFGDNHNGLHWPNLPDLVRRYDVMLGVVRETGKEETTLLDFGCGTAMFYEHMLKKNAPPKIKYSGLDLSPKFVDFCKKKFPEVDFYCLDILKNPNALGTFDYIIMNGVFTEKLDLPFSDMLDYFQRMAAAVFSKVRIGMAFNVMSKQVDWEKDFLFHLPLDTLAFFLTRELSRNFIIRNDYGLYEYTTYVYK
ncbi:MAG: class I SAM-dependent methyltransferase [Nitrospinae bacterium]|nr:class I SAM-dependent methyltransferase [Nitrospinota bacterium]